MPATTNDSLHKGICSTGLQGLDAIINGGLPSNCFYLVQGDPGSGKTTLALQFLFEGRRRGEPVLYITLSETRDELEKVATSHGWSLEGIPLLEFSAIESLTQPESQTTVFHAAEMELSKVTKLLRDEIAKHRPKRLVFDSLSEFRLLAETPLRYRRQLLNLKQDLARQGSTVLLLDDKMDSNRIGSDPHVLSLTHGVIEMEQLSPDYGKSRRRLRVMKMRGVGFSEGYHDYIIETGGIRVFPRLIAADHHVDFKQESVSSGCAPLDELLGGGLDRGTTALIMGPAGTGKSTLALQYACSMAERGEHSLLFTFDETRQTMLARADALGLGLVEHIRNGLIQVQQVDPAEISPGEFAGRIQDGVEKGARMVAIDTLNGYLNAMPGEQYLANQLHELSAYLNQQGILTIFTLAQHGVVSTLESPVDLSYLADTVLSLRYFESAGAMKKAIAVMKKRSGRHEQTIREFALRTGKGIRIGGPLTEFQGILTGVPQFRGSLEQIMQRNDGE
ncbi:ATPase domain-containing protein [Occallatibacter riparius]|uniref:non-specific serine/threonine protein kinase n=1 Tax=Occallatibacter riparius TaxID=1002689 RepID=A0A9J7BNV6_9BACT|nr:ATPase domain-containing protein [Occallatibacter riparius]UWZ82598.1 AAA family ATPase [Occallatibacter riparius]